LIFIELYHIKKKHTKVINFTFVKHKYKTNTIIEYTTLSYLFRSLSRLYIIQEPYTQNKILNHPFPKIIICKSDRNQSNAHVIT